MGNITETSVFEEMVKDTETKLFEDKLENMINEIISEQGKKDIDVLNTLHSYHKEILTTTADCIEQFRDKRDASNKDKNINQGWVEALRYSEKIFNECFEKVKDTIINDQEKK